MSRCPSSNAGRRRSDDGVRADSGFPRRSPEQQRTAAIGIWAACSGVGLAVGPILAGALLEHFSWHAVYIANIVIAGLALLLAPVFVTESKHPTRKLDPAGLVLGTVMTASATYAIIQGGATGYTKAPIITMYVVFAVALVLFVRTELRHPDPMLDLRLFRSASFSAVMGVAAISVFGLVGVALLSVLYMERVGQASPLEVGVRLLPLFGTFLLVTVVSARVLVHRIGFTPLITAGLVFIGASSLALLAWLASWGRCSARVCSRPSSRVASLGTCTTASSRQASHRRRQTRSWTAPHTGPPRHISPRPLLA